MYVLTWICNPFRNTLKQSLQHDVALKPIGNLLRCTIPGPDSSYSSLEIHKFWNVLSDAKMEPPIQTEYLRSGGATTLTWEQPLVLAKTANYKRKTYLDAARGMAGKLLGHTIGKTWEHGRASR